MSWKTKISSMESDRPGCSHDKEDRLSSGLNAQVLDYYKRFGRDRNLEQYFSLNTVQGDIRDLSSMFWRSTKTQSDSDDGRHSGASSAEVCRISISVTGAADSQENSSHSDKHEPESPPIINEDPNQPELTPDKEDGQEKPDLDTSKKSAELNLDNSIYKAQSPTSSVTSQRKLEWDSLGDVGYANEKKISSSLSTLERLAMQQQLSISENVKDNISGRPNAYSTPQDEENSRRKKNSKKSLLKQVTKTSQKETDVLEVNVKKANSTPNIAFNLTKHIKFNVDSMTGATVVSGKTNKSEEKSETASNAQELLNKEIQTSISGASSHQEKVNRVIATVPVFLNLESLKLKKCQGLKYYRRAHRKKKKILKHKRRAASENLEKNIPVSEITLGGSQVSETDSFEYMPAHVYNLNKAESKPKDDSNPGTSNKTSSLESSGGYTTLSSKQSQQSFTRDLEKSIALLNKLVQHKRDDAELKRKLVKQVVRRLIKTNYRDDETGTEFLSGLSLNSMSLGLKDQPKHQTTTSTSDGNNSGETSLRPRKPILRSPKGVIKKQPSQQTQVIKDTVSQVYTSKEPINIRTRKFIAGENTSKEKSTSDSELAKTSSEYLYQRYLEALNREQKYKQQLKTKQLLLKQTLSEKDASDDNLRAQDFEVSSMKDLISDLTSIRKGGGDAMLSQANPESYRNLNSSRFKSHSVFTITSNHPNNFPIEAGYSQQTQKRNDSSSKSEKSNTEERNTLPKNSKGNTHHSLCPMQSTVKPVQEHIDSRRDDIRYHIAKSEEFLKSKLPGTSNKLVCFCSSDKKILDDIPENFVIYSCCKNPFLSEDPSKKSVSIQCSAQDHCKGSVVTKIDVPISSSGSNMKVSAKGKSYLLSADADVRLSQHKLKQTSHQPHSVPQTYRKSTRDRRYSENLDKFEKLCTTMHFVSDTTQEKNVGKESTHPCDGFIRFKGKIGHVPETIVAEKSLAELCPSETVVVKKPLLEKEIIINEIDRFKKDSDSRKSKSSYDNNTPDYADLDINTQISKSTIHSKGHNTVKEFDDQNENNKYTSTSKLVVTRNVKIGPNENRRETKKKKSQTDDSNKSSSNHTDYTEEWVQKESERIETKSSSSNSAETKSRGKYNKVISETKTSTANSSGSNITKEDLLESIEDIIKRYKKTKKISPDKKFRRKEYKEIITQLHYLLQTENEDETSSSSSGHVGDNVRLENKTQTASEMSVKQSKGRENRAKSYAATQLRGGSSYSNLPCKEIYYSLPDHKIFVREETSDSPFVPDKSDTDLPETSETAFTYRIVGNIKKNCDKYHKKHSIECCDYSSGTSIQRQTHELTQKKLKSAHRHACRHSKKTKQTERTCTKSIAYNLIIEPSNNLTQKPKNAPEKEQKLRDVIIKVPSIRAAVSDKGSKKNVHAEKPFEINDEDSKENTSSNTRTGANEDDHNVGRPSTSACSSVKKIKFLTLREYLERNRPDFVQNATQRQHCLSVISESRKQHEALRRRLVSLQLHPDSSDDVHLSPEELRQLASQVGDELRRMRPPQKIFDERRMKAHSRRIYKSLPEVTKKKENIKKENVKKTNLVMTTLFNKNLQRRALKGGVDISNYSQIIKI